MDERGLRGLIDQVRAGAMSRRAFVLRMAAVGFTAPMATQLLALSGVAMAKSRPDYKPTKRGGGGLLCGRDAGPRGSCFGHRSDSLDWRRVRSPSRRVTVGVYAGVSKGQSLPPTGWHTPRQTGAKQRQCLLKVGGTNLPTAAQVEGRQG